MNKEKDGPEEGQKKTATVKPPTAIQKTFARNVLTAREAAGLTQRELAKLTGGTQHHVSEIEAGTGNVTLAVLARYAHALGVLEVDLLTPKPDEPPRRKKPVRRKKSLKP